MSRRWFRVVVASVFFVAWTGTATAWAQNEPPPENPPANFGPPPPGHEPPPPWTPGDSSAAPAPVVSDIAPGFMTLDRVDAHTRLGLQVGYNRLDDFPLGEDFLRFNLFGQFVFPGTKGGIYGQVPISARVPERRGRDWLRQPRARWVLPTNRLERPDLARRPGRGDGI